MSLTPAILATEERLLEAAGEVFAELGFRAATVREICRRAGQANVAAVNYHFGSKESLYLAVLRYAHGRVTEQLPAEAPVGGTSPRDRLAAFVRHFLHRLLDQRRPAWHHKIILREISEPSRVLDPLVEEVMRPHFELLRGIVTDLLGPGASPDRIRFCINSVLGQCLYYRHCRSVIEHLEPEQGFEPADIDAIAGHVAQFSLAAMHAPRASGNGKGGKR